MNTSLTLWWLQMQSLISKCSQDRKCISNILLAVSDVMLPFITQKLPSDTSTNPDTAATKQET